MIRTVSSAALAFFIATAAFADDTPSAASSGSPDAGKSAVAPLSAAASGDDSAAAASSGSPDAGKSSIKPLSELPTASGKPFVYKPAESDILYGKEDAPVLIVEYASLSCPHCSHFYLHSMPDLTAKYIDTGKVRLVYRNYPLNDPALKAAELVDCAAPESRKAFIKVLFSTQLKWAYDVNYRDALSNIAAVGGVDRLKFESCMNNKAIEKEILTIAKEAAEVYKVNSTPSFFINGAAYKGDHDAPSISKVIDAAYAAVTK